MRIIDNFYADPEAIRRLALRLPYVRLETFHGLYQSDKSLASSQTVDILSKLVGYPIQYDVNKRTFGVFRIAMESDADQTNIHRDLHDWSAVLHLSPSVYNKGSGTGFFKHRATGLIGPPPGEPEDGDLMTRIFSDGRDASAWEMYDFIESRFNRMVIFRGRDYFHDTIGRFGDKPENARLTQNFFFSAKLT